MNKTISFGIGDALFSPPVRYSRALLTFGVKSLTIFDPRNPEKEIYLDQRHCIHIGTEVKRKDPMWVSFPDDWFITPDNVEEKILGYRWGALICEKCNSIFPYDTETYQKKNANSSYVCSFCSGEAYYPGGLPRLNIILTESFRNLKNIVDNGIIPIDRFLKTTFRIKDE